MAESHEAKSLLKARLGGEEGEEAELEEGLVAAKSRWPRVRIVTLRIVSLSGMCQGQESIHASWRKTHAYQGCAITSAIIN